MTLIIRANKGEALTYEELDGNFTHLGGDGSYQFPATDGLSNQILVTDGNGQLSFVDQFAGTVVGEVTPTLFKPPMLTQIEIDALTPAPGMIVYNTTTGKFQGYAEDANNDSTTAWADLH